MTNKQFDILRLLQWLIPSLVTLYGVVDRVFGIGAVGTVETLASALVAFIGVVAQHSSAQYFSTKTIVTKILPDKEDGEEAE